MLSTFCLSFLFFFFQAEDGIRDHCVTGVQTCALPISAFRRCVRMRPLRILGTDRSRGSPGPGPSTTRSNPSSPSRSSYPRSEERRVGKGVDLGGRRILKKKTRDK